MRLCQCRGVSFARRLVVALLLTPCLAAGQTQASARDATILATSFASELGVDVSKLVRVSSAVFIDDLVQGSGDEAHRGLVALTRVNVYLADGTPVLPVTCSSFQFQIGTGLVIDGVDAGVVGMKPGGTRLMVIGAERAYGELGVRNQVPPGATLVVRLQLRLLSEGRFPDPNECVRT